MLLVRGEVMLLERCLRRGNDVPKADPLAPQTAASPTISMYKHFYPQEGWRGKRNSDAGEGRQVCSEAPVENST